MRNRVIKRIFDIIMGLIICIPAVPILILCYFWVKFDSKGPVFFNAKRIGKMARNLLVINSVLCI